MELKNLNIEVIYSNKQLNPSPLFPLFFRLGNFAFLTLHQKRKRIGIHYFLVTQAACVSPAVRESRSVPLFRSCRTVPRAAGKKVGAWEYPLPRAAPRALQLSRGLDGDRPLPSTPKPSRLGAWLHFHYVFMMPSALSRNHGSCLAFLKYHGKWSNNQITSLTE